MPPVKILTTQNEKYERKKQNNNNILGPKEGRLPVLYIDQYYSARLSFYKYDNITGNIPMASEGATLTVIDDKAFLIGGRGLEFHQEIHCFLIGIFFKPQICKRIRKKKVEISKAL